VKFAWAVLVIGSCLVVAHFALSPRLSPCPKVGEKHDCYASLKYSDGSIYTGEWFNGEMTGNGEFKFHTGVKYIGQFQNGKFHGWGQLTQTNGRTQEGKWKNGRLLFKFIFPS